ncbi:MAG: hypothetical protein H8E78_07830 [Proteobacteria bacterium]|nr:hypothetical protein [Pseudomonadota bacterium]
MLLTPESEAPERLAVKDLKDFTRAALQVVQGLFGARQPDQPQELVVELTIQPGGTVGVRLRSSPGLSRTILDHLRLELMWLPCPIIEGGPVAFEAYFLVWADLMTLH